MTHVIDSKVTTRPDFERRSPERMERARTIARTQVLINLACVAIGALVAAAYLTR